MPIDYKRYPANWKTEIRPRILEREQHRCKFCGARNGSDIVPYRCCREPIIGEDRRCRSCGRRGAPRVVLTVAHLDHDVANNAESNLAALCQRCHLRHDARQHAENARRTREQRSGQMDLFLEPATRP